MKFALFISRLSGGGAERVMSLLANHWVSRGDSVVLVTYERASSDYPLDSRVERISLDMHRVSRGFLDALVSNWRRLVALRRTLRAAGPSVVISFEERMNAFVLLIAIGRNVPCIISERTDPRRHDVALLWAALRRLTYPLADALVVQTEAVRPWACRAMLDRSRVHVIANPVRSMERYMRGNARTPGHRVVAVGRLVNGKGFDVLLRAFARIGGAYGHWRLVIVGDGPERRALAELAHELAIADRLTITGWISEPGEVLATADIYVLPSRYEGFPNALLEAMSCGVPVVATACAGASEILTHAVDAFLVPVEGVAELVDAMVRLMADEQLRLQFATRALATAERYKIDVIASRWDKVITAPAFASGGVLQNSEK